jgi:hypothetical protein
MNIKIPYTHIGNLNEILHVLVVAVKNNKAIYTREISKQEMMVLNHNAQEFIIIPDDVYESCDSVEFCPFSRDKTWRRRIALRKKDKEFSVINGGLEFIKNPDKLGDEKSLKMLKKWIKRGVDIKIDDNIKGEKNLIYFSAFGDSGYIELLKYLLKGLKKQPYQNFDLLFITDKRTKKLIEKMPLIKHFNVHYLIMHKIVDTVEASMQKLKIYEFEKINDYKKILFLDLDILIVGDLSKIFEERVRPNVFYSASHRIDKTLHRSVYHTIQQYSDVHIAVLDFKCIFAFNAGQFFFMNTSTMIKHFKNIYEFAQKWPGQYFFEQSFMNTYFNILMISNIFKFKDQFCFIPVNTEETRTVTNPDSVTVHYMGSIANTGGKLGHIKKYYKYLLP